MKEDIKKKYDKQVIIDKHLTNEYLLKTFYIKYSIKKLLNHHLKHGCFYYIHMEDYGDYLTEEIVLKQMKKLQRKVSNKIILTERTNSWTYVLEEDKQD
jgi:predicted oxidoreductase